MLFVCKENKNNDFVQQLLLFRVSLRRAFRRVLGLIIFVFFAN